MPTLIEHFGFCLSSLSVLREWPKHLTTRCSQPLADVLRKLRVERWWLKVKYSSPPPAVAQLRLVRRTYRMSIESDIVERVNSAASKKQIPISDTRQK